MNVRLSKNLRNRRLIYEREAEVRLDDVIFGRFSADATREEIQRKAFEATEKKICNLFTADAGVGAGQRRTPRLSYSHVQVTEGSRRSTNWANALIGFVTASSGRTAHGGSTGPQVPVSERYARIAKPPQRACELNHGDACTITSPPEYQPTVAQCVNASEFWQAYFDEIEKTTAGPLIDFKLEMEREVTGKSRGDYDPGWVNVRLSVKNLRNRRLIYEARGGPSPCSTPR